MEDNMGWDYQCHSEKKLRTTMVAIAQPAMAKKSIDETNLS